MEKTEQENIERPLISHITELFRRLRTILVVLALVFFVSFAFGIKMISYAGYTIPVPYPSIYSSISDYVIKSFIYNELPKGMILINVNTFDPLFASFYVSFFLSLFVAVPVAIYEMWAFVAPGLYKHEKKLIKLAVLPAAALFAAGASFAYFIIVPFMLKFVLMYAKILGIMPTLSVRAFINTVISLMMATGIAFEYPMAMTVLTFMGIVSAKSWKSGWRWGIIGAFIIAWIISPGTTGGIIETTIGLMLSGLYFVGLAAAYAIEKRTKKNKKL